MAKRSTKFYRKNELEVMAKFGLKGTSNSGAGWIEKEDGQNEFVIAQLKSTDADSFKLSHRDIQVLEYNAAVCKKIPLFIVEFLKHDETLLIIKPNDLVEIAKYIETGVCKPHETIIDDSVDTCRPMLEANVKKSSKKARENFWKESENQYKNRRK